MVKDSYGYAEEAPVRGRRWKLALALLLLGFASGIAATAWTIGRFDPLDAFVRARFGKPSFSGAPPAAPVRIVATPPPPAVQPDAVQTIALASRLDTLAARLDAIDSRARAATGNADRAEELLVAFAARRALDRGVELGYIEGLLRERFAASQPQAVATIIAAARAPVTLAWLEAELDRVGPELTGRGPNESWWSAARRELAGMIVVRRADAPPTAPVERVARAERALESGQADVALAEVARVPGNVAAMQWMMAARRYVSSRAALDRIETAALLQPRAEDQPPDADMPGGPAAPSPSVAKPAAPSAPPAPAPDRSKAPEQKASEPNRAEPTHPATKPKRPEAQPAKTRR